MRARAGPGAAAEDHRLAAFARGTPEISGTVVREHADAAAGLQAGFHSFSRPWYATVVRLLLNEPSDDRQRQRLEPR
jgi:hypothetical protein